MRSVGHVMLWLPSHCAGGDSDLGVQELNDTHYEVVVKGTLNATSHSTYDLVITVSTYLVIVVST